MEILLSFIKSRFSQAFGGTGENGLFQGNRGANSFLTGELSNKASILRNMGTQNFVSTKKYIYCPSCIKTKTATSVIYTIYIKGLL